MNREFTQGRTHARRGWMPRLAGAVLALILVPSLLSAQGIDDKHRLKRERDSRFNLTSSPTAVLQVNLFQCGLRNSGDTCTDVFNSPTGGGGFWPTGTANDYMFNSGLKIAGIIPRDAGFAWAGDTVGAFFFDASGLRAHGTPVTEIYNSLDLVDQANWPVAGTFPDFPNATAMVEDTALFNEVLLGRQSASQQDSWVMYWDGDPGPTGGRQHPMGILVEQRSLAWNYPAGNESIIYFIYKFTNVTNNTLFQRLNETRFFAGRNELPDEGWRFDSVYVAFAADPDVTHDFRANYATALLPFNMGIAYDGTMFEPDWDYPPSLFYPPFFTNSPGIIGVKYLQSPIDPTTGEEVGLTGFSLFTNGAPFADPRDAQQGWRYLSLNIDAGKGDPSCTFSLEEARERRSCFLNQSQADVRFFMASGPFSLGPGETATVAVAMFAAATVATPLIQRGASADNKPGFPTLAPGCAGQPIRPIEVGAGWLRSAVCPGEGEEQINQFDVEYVPNSLIGKALVAQAIFDNKFLLPFAPEPPTFFLVPGDNRVTIVWEPSRTDQLGDPFFSAAGDPNNPLFDPNFRQFDVEGYRIYRGTDPATLRLIAQFDKTGTTFLDVRCVTVESHPTAEECTEEHEVPLSGEFVQYTSVVRLADGGTLVSARDILLEERIDEGTAFALSDTGVPFAFVDNGARNGFQYFYRVTAFDVNSVISGPSSLESAGPAKSTTPSRAAPNLALAGFQSTLLGSGDTPLDPSAPTPTIHPQNGTFDGPMPPTNSVEGTFAPLVERLLPEMTLEVQIDSVKPFYTAAQCPAGQAAQLGSCWKMYLTINRDGVLTQVVQDGYTNVWSAFGGPVETEYTLAAERIDADATSAAAYGIPAGFAGFNAAVVGLFRQSIEYSSHVGQAQNRSGSGIPGTAGVTLVAGGSRWFSGAAETLADPARLDRAGSLPGVDTIFSPSSPGGGLATGVNNACWGYQASFLSRAADVEVRWSGAGAPTVHDVTHDVPVQFKPSTQASWGFLTTDANGNGVIDYDDFHYIEGIHAATVTCTPNPRTPVQLTQTLPATLPNVNATRVAPTGMQPTGTGFGLYINGERYIFQMAAPPTTGTWTLRTYTGFVQASSGGNTQDPSGYSFTSRPRSPMVPGLRVQFQVEEATSLVGEATLDNVHTVPDPFYAASLFDRSPAAKEIQFVNLPAEATIRIYSLSGILVDMITHNAPEGSGRATWDVRNRSGQFVASGVYLYHVSTPDGRSRVGKFTVINSGFAR